MAHNIPETRKQNGSWQRIQGSEEREIKLISAKKSFKKKREVVQKKKLINTRCESNFNAVSDKASELSINKWLEERCMWMSYLTTLTNILVMKAFLKRFSSVAPDSHLDNSTTLFLTKLEQNFKKFDFCYNFI